MPQRPLLWLTVAVVAAHLLVLQATTGSLPPAATPLSHSFITRSIVLAPAPPASPQASRPERAVPRKKTQPHAAAPAPLAAQAPPAPVSELAPTASLTVAEDLPTAPDGNTTATAADTPAAEAAAPATPPATERPPAHTVPGSQRLKYTIIGEVRSLTYHASGELLWKHDGKAYEARLEVSAFLLGSRVQTSTGQLTAAGLEPKRFADKVRSEVAAHFVRDKGKVIFSANTPEVPLQPGAQDHLSIFVQLASLLAGEPERYPPGSAIDMQAIGAREADNWRFTVDGPELLQLPRGEQATVKLTRPARQTDDLKVELWLAPALGYLPARIRLTQNNGDFIDLQWRTSAEL